MHDESAQNSNMYGNGSTSLAASSFDAATKQVELQPSAVHTGPTVRTSTPPVSSAPSFSWQKTTNTAVSTPVSQATSAPVLSQRLQVKGAVGNLASLRNVDPRYSAAEEALLSDVIPSDSPAPSPVTPTIAVSTERRTTPSISPRLRYTSQSRRTAAPIQEVSPDSKAALALEKPSQISSAQLQAEATSLPYKPQPSQQLSRLERPIHHTATPITNAQPRSTAPTLGAQTQPRQRAAAPTLGVQPTQQHPTPALGAQPYQPRTAASLGTQTRGAAPTAPTLGAQPQRQRTTAPTLGAQTQPQQATTPTLSAQPTQQRPTPALGAQPYQPRTAASLGTQTRGAAPTLGAQPQQQRTTAPTLGAQTQPQQATAPNLSAQTTQQQRTATSTLGTQTQARRTPDPYQPGKAANYPATQPGADVSTDTTARNTSATSVKNVPETAAKPRRRPSVPNQPILKNSASNRGGSKTQSARPVPTVSATPPKEFLKEKERKALLAQRVAEYNNIQSYYASYMAYYEQQQNRLEQLIKDEKTSSIERKHLFEQQSDLYQKQRALFQLQTSLYEFVSSKTFNPSSPLPFTPLDEEAAAGPKKFDKSPEEHWSAILGSEIKKQPKKQHKRENEKPYKITKKHESVLERRMRRMEELKRWEKEWKQYYKTDSFWRKQRYWGAFLFIVGVAIVVGILNISNVLKWFASDYEVPLLPIETHDLKTNYQQGYIPVHKGDMVPVDSRLISEKSPYNVMALRNGGNLRIDKYSDLLIENLKTDKNGRFLSGFFLRQGRVFAYSTPESMVFIMTPQVRITPVNDKNTMYAVALKTDAKGNQFTLLSVYRGMCVVGYTTGTLQTVRISAGQALKSYSTRLGTPEGLRQPDKWTKWNYNWDATDTYISPLASPKITNEPEEEEEETLEEEASTNAVEAFTKKQAADKEKEAKAKAKKKANKQKSKTKKMKK